MCIALDYSLGQALLIGYIIGRTIQIKVWCYKHLRLCRQTCYNSQYVCMQIEQNTEGFPFSCGTFSFYSEVNVRSYQHVMWMGVSHPFLTTKRHSHSDLNSWHVFQYA